MNYHAALVRFAHRFVRDRAPFEPRVEQWYVVSWTKITVAECMKLITPNEDEIVKNVVAIENCLISRLDSLPGNTNRKVNAILLSQISLNSLSFSFIFFLFLFQLCWLASKISFSVYLNCRLKINTKYQHRVLTIFTVQIRKGKFILKNQTVFQKKPTQVYSIYKLKSMIKIWPCSLVDSSSLNHFSCN